MKLPFLGNFDIASVNGFKIDTTTITRHPTESAAPNVAGECRHACTMQERREQIRHPTESAGSPAPNVNAITRVTDYNDPEKETPWIRILGRW